MKWQLRLSVFCLWAALFGIPGWVLGQTASPQKNAATFKVAGDVSRPAEYTTAQLEKEFSKEIQTVDYALREEKGRARVVPLLALVKAAAPPTDPKRKNALLAYAVAVSAADGYCVTFSYGELSAQEGKSPVYLALDRDDHPLPEDQSPVRLLVPGDARPARWIYGVTEIRLVNLSRE